MNAETPAGQAATLQQLVDLQRRLLARLEQLTGAAPQSWYSPMEVARLIDRAPATVRGWCRQGRLAARKRSVGRGDKLDWEISATELQRYRDHGLLPQESQHD